MYLHRVYFWTSTIINWQMLLTPDKYKQFIVDSLKHLVKTQKITVYAFVIMPNHIHLVWRLEAMNGKEAPHASFHKFTAHVLIQDLKDYFPHLLKHYRVEEKDRTHRVWQRDALAVLIDSRKKAEQTINYIHNNPMAGRWNLSDTPEDYYWSSASYYELEKDEFGFLTHYLEEF